ncbi:unnamed protein product [Kluyveromyces dobzhanskii CBS 2104]|uniref:DASH complex subunit SPC19 n=1 Tax=Kluyveromyces dobzhanskii CBS 2104 TaxID=1427455 RepID=A0A0A8L790_9SACH|nr:unnamed protein product [Kluyveromyces dobzhanskii CBS 2104]
MEHLLSESVDALSACVDNMEKCLIASKITTDSSTKVANNMLQTKRVFQLVSEYDVQRARLDLMEEIEPLLQKLYNKLEKGLNKVERERATLSQTFELNKLRLNNQETSPLGGAVKSDPVVIVSSTHEELEQLRELKNRKEDLMQKIQQLRGDG